MYQFSSSFHLQKASSYPMYSTKSIMTLEQTRLASVHPVLRRTYGALGAAFVTVSFASGAVEQVSGLPQSRRARSATNEPASRTDDVARSVRYLPEPESRQCYLSFPAGVTFHGMGIFLRAQMFTLDPGLVDCPSSHGSAPISDDDSRTTLLAGRGFWRLLYTGAGQLRSLHVNNVMTGSGRPRQFVAWTGMQEPGECIQSCMAPRHLGTP